MPTKPASAPLAKPSALGLPTLNHSVNIQPRMPAHAPNWVLSMTMPEVPFSPPPEPILKPNQPTHSIAAPTMVRLRLCAGIGVFW